MTSPEDNPADSPYTRYTQLEDRQMTHAEEEFCRSVGLGIRNLLIIREAADDNELRRQRPVYYFCCIKLWRYIFG